MLKKSEVVAGRGSARATIGSSHWLCRLVSKRKLGPLVPRASTVTMTAAPRDDVLHRRARRVRAAREALLDRGVVAEGAEAGDEPVADAVVLRAADRMRHVADDLAVERQRALGGELVRGRRGWLRRGAAEP